MLFAGPFSGRLGARYGSRVPLALGALSSGLSYAWLAVFHDARIDIYFASVLLGLGVGMALAAMANLVVEAVPPDVTGVASAINAIMRTIGGAVGAQVAAAIVSGSLAAGALYPAESGFTGAFAMSAVASGGHLARVLRHPLARGRARAHAGDRRRPRRREQPR